MKHIKLFEDFVNEREITAEELVKKIIKGNSRFKWLKDDLPKDYTLDDVKNLLDDAGYGKEYDKYIKEGKAVYGKSSWKDFQFELEKNGWKTKNGSSSFKDFKASDHKDIGGLPKKGELEISPSQYGGALDWLISDENGKKVASGDYPNAAGSTASQMEDNLWETIKFLMNGPL